MKFLVITDLHQKKSAVEWINAEIEKNSAEFVLFLGDVTDFGTGEDAADIISSIKSKVYVIPGNCDPRDLPLKISDVAVDMHGKSIDLDGYKLVGLGGSNITIFNTTFELTEEELYDGLDLISSEGMILMTHAPSHGILDEIPSGLNVGSPAVRRIVEKYHPVLALSGHIHEAIGVEKIGDTVFCNPGPARDGHCAAIEVIEGVVTVKLIGPLDG